MLGGEEGRGLIMPKYQKSKILENIKIFAVPSVLALWLLNLCVVFYFNNLTSSGTFGDAFGAVNALFSGLAFAGLLYAILLQHEELSLQRKELRDTRKEFEIQNETLKRQRFENTFFNMLSLHNEIINNTYYYSYNYRTITSPGEREVISGRDVYKKIYQSIISKYKEMNNDKNFKTNDIIEGYFEEKHQSQLGHYFRNIYTILKFIDESNIENKEIYTSIFESQLSNQELCLLFYNCFSTKKERNLKNM